jgi:hypothetical protein
MSAGPIDNAAEIFSQILARKSIIQLKSLFFIAQSALDHPKELELPLDNLSQSEGE